MDGLEIGLEFDEVFHHGLGGRIEIFLAESVEIFEPQFFEGGSDVFRFELFEQILHFVHGAGVAAFFGHFLLQKTHEVRSDRGIDQHISVQPCVVIPLEHFDIPHLREISERIDVVHEQLDIHFIFEPLDDVDDVVELVANGDHVEEIHEHAGRVALNVLNLVGQFSFEFGTHQGDRDVGVVQHQVRSVIGVFQELRL